ncbi:MAG: DUF1365 domain-containing protein [Alphaproteobacteria bacterium]|nr:DUF1365 domain-containing protein [Alphaproteobacteria bacterium]
MTAWLGLGEVRHTRLRPVRHAFVHPTWFLMLPMRKLSSQGDMGVAINRRAWVAFHDADHGDGRGPEVGGALAWLFEMLADQGVDDVDGEVWLHCYPRVLGYAFKPVSFWYAHRADGSLRAVVAEVNNTFGERHSYLLDHPREGQVLTARKVFHVSPFCEVKGEYQFRFMRTWTAPGQPSRTVARIDLHDDEGLLLQTSICGRLQAANPAELRRAVWRHPWLTLGVILRIHWHALQLWRKRVRFFHKPTPPADFVTR